MVLVPASAPAVVVQVDGYRLVLRARTTVNVPARSANPLTARLGSTSGAVEGLCGDDGEDGDDGDDGFDGDDGDDGDAWALELVKSTNAEASRESFR